MALVTEAVKKTLQMSPFQRRYRSWKPPSAERLRHRCDLSQQPLALRLGIRVLAEHKVEARLEVDGHEHAAHAVARDASRHRQTRRQSSSRRNTSGSDTSASLAGTLTLLRSSVRF